MIHSNQAASIEAFKKTLKSKGLKLTAQRLTVHKAMMELGHACAESVFEKIKADGGHIPASTVYNILSQMALLGIYSHRFSIDNRLFFDVNNTRHFHLYDVLNHEYKDIELDKKLMKAIEDALGKRKFKGYKTDGLDIQIICHPSRKKVNINF